MDTTTEERREQLLATHERIMRMVCQLTNDGKLHGVWQEASEELLNIGTLLDTEYTREEHVRRWDRYTKDAIAAKHGLTPEVSQATHEEADRLMREWSQPDTFTPDAISQPEPAETTAATFDASKPLRDQLIAAGWPSDGDLVSMSRRKRWDGSNALEEPLAYLVGSLGATTTATLFIGRQGVGSDGKRWQPSMNVIGYYPGIDERNYVSGPELRDGDPLPSPPPEITILMRAKDNAHYQQTTQRSGGWAQRRHRDLTSDIQQAARQRFEREVRNAQSEIERGTKKRMPRVLKDAQERLRVAQAALVHMATYDSTRYDGPRSYDPRYDGFMSAYSEVRYQRAWIDAMEAYDARDRAAAQVYQHRTDALWREARETSTTEKATTTTKVPVSVAAPEPTSPVSPSVDMTATALEIRPDRDTRDNSTIYVARIPNRVDRDTYDRIAREVKRLGGYYSSYKKGFLFRGDDPTDKLKAAGLADTLTSLGDLAMGEDMTLGDGRLSRLQVQFRKLVSMYAMALCLERIDAVAVPAIDAEFSTIGTMVEMSFDVLKHQELESCRRERMDRTATNVPKPSAVRNAPVVDILDRQWSEADFRRHTLPYVMQTMAEDARIAWENTKASLDELTKKPDTFDGSKEAYLRTIAARVNDLKRSRDESYRLYTALRNKWEFQTDTPDDVKAIVWREQAQLYRQWSSRLTPEAIDVRLQDLDKRMRAAAAYEHYPTPVAIVDSMLDYANITAGDRVLEPSAGEGNIAGRILEKHPEAHLEVVEYDEILRDILTLKGYTVVGEDFLQYQPVVPYDVIVMNPPFDRGVDIEHVYHAFKMLNDGGRLVAITSAAAIDGGDEANYAFKEFIEQRGSYRLLSARDYMGPAGRLTNGRQISISVGIITLTKPAGDTFGRQVQVSIGTATAGMMVYDTQGASLYLIESIDTADGKTTTTATNMATRQARSFNGEIKIGTGRFMAVEGDQASLILERLMSESVERDSTGKIKLPRRPSVGPEGEPGLKPLRIVTSRQELMPAAPESVLFSKRIADNVSLTPGQLEGTNRAMAALESPARSFMLADGTGFGKTLQQLVVAATIVERSKKPALIFTKAPSIIETSFYPDARKLKISTPDAQNKSDRKVFNGRDASGLSMKRVSSLSDIAGKALNPKTVYIASYHVFGGWKGDASERRRMLDHYANIVKPMRERADKEKQDITSNSYISDEQKRHLKKEIEDAFLTSPAYRKYLELRQLWEQVNRDFFSELGSKFSIVISDEAHAYKNYNPDDIEDGSLQAFRGMVLYSFAERGMYCTATPADKVEHIRYLKPLGIYKTEAQYMRMMSKMGFVWHDPEYVGTTLVRGGGFGMDARIPPELVLTNISRLFENLTMAGTMIKRELSLDNFEARNIMIGGRDASPQEAIAVEQARNVLGQIDAKLGKIKKCKASLINEKKWALEPFKVQKVIEITKRELLEGRQVVIFASLVNDSGPSHSIGGGPCMAVDKPSTVNVLKRELGALFGEDQIGFVTGIRKSDDETLGDDATSDLNTDRTYADEHHDRSFFGSSAEISALGDCGLSDRTQRERADDIRAFQDGRKRILIATPEAGGTGISLDDTVGSAPRTIIIMTAPFSSVEVVQILGRINRAQTKSRQRAYFLWVDVPIDKRLRDIIASKLRILGAAVQGEVKKVSVEEVEFATSENAQENYDKHNIDKDGKLRKHSLESLQVIDGTTMPSRKPFVLTHKSTLGTEIEADGLTRVRYAPIRMFYAGKSGGRQLLTEWMSQNQTIVEKYRVTLETDRYEGPYLEARFNDELWAYMLNWMKPENTRFALNDVALFKIGDRIRAATDIIEADAAAGAEGTITRIWERRIRALDIETGKQVMTETGEQVWKYQYDYMVEFDNGERANNLENWEIVAATESMPEEIAVHESEVFADALDTIEHGNGSTLPSVDGESTPEASVAQSEPTLLSLSDRITAMEAEMRQRVRESRHER